MKVANLQHAAALLRHEFAVETAAYLANRVLNAEQWFRLANSIRSIADTYLRYAVEIAFLAEQAYEFEAHKQMNVIRFDYDISELGEYLAGDFLLRDLDTLEHDLVVTQREREQHVRYALSMAREFPEALQELRDTGWDAQNPRRSSSATAASATASCRFMSWLPKAIGLHVHSYRATSATTLAACP